MRLLKYINEEYNQDFLKLEDKIIAKKYDYGFLTLKKVPKELNIVLKMLKKHVKTPLKSIQYRNGTSGDGGMNLAVFSESLDTMQINITNIKKLKSHKKQSVTNFNDQLEANKKSLEKWKEFQKKAITQKDKKKARGVISRLSNEIIKLEDKIKKGEMPLPSTCVSYTSNFEQAVESVILHELGHREKNKTDLFKLQIFFNNGNFPTDYSKRNISEYHSEIYSLVKMKLIDKAPISDEAKKYFKNNIK